MIVFRAFKPFLPLVIILYGRGWAAMPQPLPPERMADICDRILSSAAAPVEPVQITHDYVLRRTEVILDEIYTVGELGGPNDFVPTAELKRAQGELKQIINYVKANPQQFDRDFRDLLFKSYYGLLLELELREVGRSLRFSTTHYYGEAREMDDETAKVARPLYDLERHVQDSMGSWDAPTWQQFTGLMQSINSQSGLPPYRTELDSQEQRKEENEFAPMMTPTPVSAETTALVRETIEKFFENETFVLTPELTNAFFAVNAKVQLVRSNITLLRPDLSPVKNEAVDTYLQNAVVAYELMHYAYQDPDLKNEIGPALNNILATMLLRYAHEAQTSQAEMVADALKKYVFYNHRRLNTDVISRLEDGLRPYQSAGRMGTVSYFVKRLNEVLIR